MWIYFAHLGSVVRLGLVGIWNGVKVKKRKDWKRWGVGVSKGGALGSYKETTQLMRGQGLGGTQG